MAGKLLEQLVVIKRFCVLLFCMAAYSCSGVGETIPVYGKVVGERDSSPVANVVVTLSVFKSGTVMGTYEKIAEQRSAEDGTFHFDVPKGRSFILESRDIGEIFGGSVRTLSQPAPGMFVELKHKHFRRD
jgi:hypothetical protein